MNKLEDFLKLGEIWYSVKNQQSYEVARINNYGAYLCRFDGSSSDIIHISFSNHVDWFEKWYKKTQIEAYRQYANSLRHDAMMIEQLIDDWGKDKG